MKKSEIQKDLGLRLAVEHKTEAAERMTLPEDFTDRLMERIGEQKPKRRRTWLYPAIGIAASILLLLALRYYNPEKESVVAQKTVEQKPLVKPSEQPSPTHIEEDHQNVVAMRATAKPRTKVRRQEPADALSTMGSTPPIVADCEAVSEREEKVCEQVANIIPPERQALADIYLAEAALQVAYRRQAQVEALRTYAVSLEEEEAAPAQPIIAF